MSLATLLILPEEMSAGFCEPRKKITKNVPFTKKIVFNIGTPEKISDFQRSEGHTLRIAGLKERDHVRKQII